VIGVPSSPPAKTGFDEDGHALFIGDPQKFSGVDVISKNVDGNLNRARWSSMSFPILFTPVQIGNLKLTNRIVIAPMGQYSAENGQMNDWRPMHLRQLESSGAALLTIEGTAFTSDGRTTYGDVGLYSDECAVSMVRVLNGVRRRSDMPIRIQQNWPYKSSIG
jgi:hypothetical protein